METIILKKGKLGVVIDGGTAWRKYPVTGCTDYLATRNGTETEDEFKKRAEGMARRLMALGW